MESHYCVINHSEFFAKSEVSCPLKSELTSSDGRLISLVRDYEINQLGSYVELQFNSAGNTNSKTTISGLIMCGDSSLNLKNNSNYSRNNPNQFYV